MYVMCAGHLGTSLAFYSTEYERGTWPFSLLEQSLTGLPVVNVRIPLPVLMVCAPISDFLVYLRSCPIPAQFLPILAVYIF